MSRDQAGGACYRWQDHQPGKACEACGATAGPVHPNTIVAAERDAQPVDGPGDNVRPQDWPRARKIAWCKERATECPWAAAWMSMIQDMDLLGIPLSPGAIQLGMLEAMNGGERAVRRLIDSIN